MSTSPNQPVAARQFDRVHVAVWRHLPESKDEPAERFTVTLSRNYRDSEGRWQRSGSFTPRDLPHLALAVQFAIDELLTKQQ